MSETAVADTGPILYLTEIGETALLSIFDSVIISDQVRGELAKHGTFRLATDALSHRLHIEKVTYREIHKQAAALSHYALHRADLSIAALAARLKPDTVLTDDLTLRKGLESQGHLVVGSAGVLFRAILRALADELPG